MHSHRYLTFLTYSSTSLNKYKIQVQKQQFNKRGNIGLSINDE